MHETRHGYRGDLSLPEAGSKAGRLPQLATLPNWGRRSLIRLQIRMAALADWLGECWRAERDAGTLFNLAPVCLGLGILAYFLAPAEPVIWLPPATALVLCVPVMRLTTDGVAKLVLILVVLFLVGMSTAQLRTTLNASPVIGGQLRGEISGTVLDKDRNSKGKPRYTIMPDRIGDLARHELPRRIRLSASSAHRTIMPGDRISGLAQVQSFSGPALPGGYDFGFFNWFQGLGGTGFFLGAPTGIQPDSDHALGSGQDMLIGLAKARIAIADRIRSALPGEAGDVAVALITGDRTGIDTDTTENLRKSGLAHILAISGLHMALVTLTVISGLRFLLALPRELALRYPVRKWAALAGLAAATFYLLLSGAGIATQRAWIMIAVMLVAVLLDRRAVTMRNVAIAALIILFVSPQSLLMPGFQMSFAAVAALVAAYEGWNGWRRHRRRETVSPVRRLWLQLPAWVAGIAFTSLVAGVATALFAAWHFHRVAPLGLVANLAAMPVVSVAVMPLALTSMLLMPYGFEQLTLAMLGRSIEWVLEISRRVAAFDAGGGLGIVAPEVFAAGVIALIMLTAFRSPLRYVAIVPILVMPALWQTPLPPDLIVSQDGRAIAIANTGGGQTLLYPRRNRFVTDIWRRAWPGQGAISTEDNSTKASEARGAAAERKSVTNDTSGSVGKCDSDHCVATLRGGQRVEVVYDPDLLDRACLSADILVAPRLRWVDCRSGRNAALILKRDDFQRNGTHAITITTTSPGTAPPAETAASTRFVVKTAFGPPGRPWNRLRLAAIEAEDKRWLERLRNRQSANPPPAPAVKPAQ